MAYLIALAVLALVGIVASVWLIRTDGYGSIPTDHARVAQSRERPIPAPVADAEASPARIDAPAPLRIQPAE